MVIRRRVVTGVALLVLCWLLYLQGKSRGPPECRPQKNVVLLKSHKCASSSVSNILIRHAVAKNLTVAVPRKGMYFGYPQHFHPSFLLSQGYGPRTYNIFPYHSRFNKTAFQMVFPNDTLYITVVRDPADIMESMYGYYGLESTFGCSLEEWALSGPDQCRKNVRFGNRIGRNQMLFDFGVLQEDFDIRDRVVSYIQRVEEQFDLVMLEENMEESLVMLAQLLCWPLSDVVTLKQNSRRPSARKTLSPEVRRGLHKYNAGDWELFLHFRRKFRERMAEFGEEELSRRVEELRELSEEMMERCGAVKEPLHTAWKVDYPVYGYVVTDEARDDPYCWHLVRSSEEWTMMLRKEMEKG